MRPRIGITSAPSMHGERQFDRLHRWYVHAVRRAGGMPLILPTLRPDDSDEMVAALDGLVLTGGGDVDARYYREAVVPEAYDVDPARDAWELALVAAAYGDCRLPILGVCRGAQLLNVAAGGSLIQHLPHVTSQSHRHREHFKDEVHTVDIEPDSCLAAIVGPRRLGVNSIHHQAISTVGEGFRPVAWAPDGIIEAIERTDDLPVVAVQWHPESLIDLPRHGQLFLWLSRAAAGRRSDLELPKEFEEFEPPSPDTTGFGRLVDDVA